MQANYFVLLVCYHCTVNTNFHKQNNSQYSLTSHFHLPLNLNLHITDNTINMSLCIFTWYTFFAALNYNINCNNNKFMNIQNEFNTLVVIHVLTTTSNQEISNICWLQFCHLVNMIKSANYAQLAIGIESEMIQIDDRSQSKTKKNLSLSSSAMANFTEKNTK